MKILDFNQSFILALTPTSAVLLRNPSLQLVSQCKGDYSLGSLQYSTGIAALATHTFVHFHDFTYNRLISQLQTHQPITFLTMLKNLLICQSPSRILIHSLSTHSPLCHIPIHSNSLPISISQDYYSLKILYPVSISATGNIYHELDVWSTKSKRLQCSACSIVKYDYRGEILCLVQDHVLALYKGDQIVRGCSFDGRIGDVIESRESGKFYVCILMENADEKKIMYAQVSINYKNYLKPIKTQQSLPQQILQQFLENSPQKQQQQQQIFEHNNKLHIIKNNNIFICEVDKQPELKFQSQIKKQISSNDSLKIEDIVTRQNQNRISIQNQNQNQNLNDDNQGEKQSGFKERYRHAKGHHGKEAEMDIWKESRQNSILVNSKSIIDDQIYVDNSISQLDQIPQEPDNQKQQPTNLDKQLQIRRSKDNQLYKKYNISPQPQPSPSPSPSPSSTLREQMPLHKLEVPKQKKQPSQQKSQEDDQRVKFSVVDQFDNLVESIINISKLSRSSDRVRSQEKKLGMEEREQKGDKGERGEKGEKGQKK